MEAICAPGFEEGVLEELASQKQRVRVVGSRFDSTKEKDSESWERHSIEGGKLVQQIDTYTTEEFQSPTQVKFPKEKYNLARFGIVAAKYIKSNAIALVYEYSNHGFQLLSMGSGQPNRVDAIKRLTFPKAIENGRSKDILAESVMVSDAFFPFEDNVEEAAKFGIRYIIQPGGSIRDSEVIARADQLGIAMAFTSKRHFRH